MEAVRRIEVPAAVDELWRFVTDLPSIVPCIPGAAIGAPTDRGYEATITATAGEFTVPFRGTASVEIIDPDERMAVIRATGRDALGTLRPDAEITVRVEAMGAGAESSVLDVRAQFRFAGVLAPAARAASGPAAALLMRRFGDNLVARFAPS